MLHVLLAAAVGLAGIICIIWLANRDDTGNIPTDIEATLIRQVTDLPVVDIHISVYDVLRTMKLAENYTSLYAIVGFPSIDMAHGNPI